MKTTVHIDISPSKDKVCCGNCANFDLFGVHIGYCNKRNRYKMDTNRCKRFNKNEKLCEQ